MTWVIVSQCMQRSALFFRRLWSSMVTRMVLAVMVALIAAQLFSFVILGRAHRTVLSDISQRSLLQQFESLVWLLENNPDSDYPAILATAQTSNTWYAVNDHNTLADKHVSPADKRLINRLLHLLGDQYHGRVFVDLDHWERSGGERHRPAFNEDCQGACDRSERTPDWQLRDRHQDRRPPAVSSLEVAVHMDNGQWLHMQAMAPIVPPLVARQTIIFLVTAMILVLVVLAVMVRRTTQPLSLLSKAAVKLGMGEQVTPVPEQGPADLRDTIRAFNQMNNRLQRFVSDRTRMLAALSHDLRTPITGMRLRVEMMPDSADRERLLTTLEEMQQMSEATLAFMRQEAENEVTRQVDLNAMTGSLCDDLAELGQAVNYQDSQKVIIRCRPVSLKRALRNLIENGVKYGQYVDVQLALYTRAGQSLAAVVIQDAGPGIPERWMEHVFEPFFRLEGSRNWDTGGMGLGMAIARNIVRNHGGEIFLKNTAAGLKVTLELPLH